ncbi:MAG: hypothetical protein U0892_18535 [Pirellulales bacterium]
MRGPAWSIGSSITPAAPPKANLGSAVALRDATAAVGAIDYDNRGAIFIFRSEAATSDQKPIATLQPNDAAKGDHFGASVAMYGGDDSLSLLGGAPLTDAGRGAVYVYTGLAESWTLEAKLSGDTVGERFGTAVAISGDTAVIGAPGSSSFYVFVRNGITWTRQFKTTIGSTSDLYGSSVAIDGDHLLVGAPGNDRVDIWQRSGTTWARVAQVSGTPGSGFGSTVSLSGDNLVIGAPAENLSGKSQAGTAYVYQNQAGQYLRTGTLNLGVDASAEDRFGTSVAIEDKRIIVGAPGRDHRYAQGDVRVNSGETFAFSLRNDQWVLETNVDPLFGSDAQAGDQMGYAVAISGDMAIVGAPQLSGRPNSTDTDGAGYAYLRSVGSPTVVIYPKEQAVLLAGAQANTISGTVGGVATSMLTFFDVNDVSVSTGFKDDTVTIGEDGFTAYGLENFYASLDGGEDTLVVLSDDFDPTEKGNLILTGDTGGAPSGSTLPSNTSNPYRSSSGVLQIDGGSGNNFLDASNDTDWTLTQNKLTSRPGDSADIENFRRTRLTGGSSPNVIQVKGYDGSVEVDGNGGPDEVTVVDTQSAVIRDSGTGSNVLTVVGTDGNDRIQITDSRIVVNGLVYDLTGVNSVRVAGGAGDDDFEINTLSTKTTIVVDGQDGSDTYLANIGTNTAGSLIRVIDSGSNPSEQDRLRLDVGTTFSSAGDLRRATNRDGVLLYDGSLESVAISGVAVDVGAPDQVIPISQVVRNYNGIDTYTVSSEAPQVVTVTIRPGAFGTSALVLDFGAPGSSIVTVTNNRTQVQDKFLVTVHSLAPTLTISSITGDRLEGSPITVTAAAQSAIGGLSYVFTVQKNGADYAVSGAQTGSSYTFTPNDNGVYVIQVSVVDQLGNASAINASITVGNVAPQISVQDVSAIIEGGTAVLRGTYSDAGTLDTHRLLVNWGDNSFETVPVSGGTFTLNHIYLDDNLSDRYTITVTLVDNDQDSVSTLKTVVVTNDDPVLTLLPTAGIDENQEATLQFLISDAGVLDTHTVDIDWGDGTFERGLPVNLSFSANHRYLDNNGNDVYPIRVTLRDDDGGVVQDIGTVLVSNVNPENTANSVAAILENGIARLTGTYSDVGPLDTHRVTIDWGDGTIQENLPVSGGTYDFSHRYLDDNDIDSYEITVIVIDKDGGENQQITTVTVTNVDPTVMLAAISAINENGIATLSGTIVDPGTLDTFTVEVNWGDPLSPDNVQLFSLPASGSGTQSFVWTHRYLDDNPSNSSSDTYRVSVRVLDKDGGIGSATQTVLVNNVAPLLSGLSATTISENGVTTLTGVINDPSILDSFTIDVNWGDVLSPNNVETYTFPAGTTSFTLTHRYLDDNPTATGSDVYTIRLKVTDDDTGTTSTQATVTVNNVAPVLSNLSATTISENGVTTLTGVINDPSILDSFTVDVSWGDSLSPNNVETYTFPAGTTSFTLTHRYLDDNPTETGSDVYTIRLKVTDDDTGTTSSQTTVTVNNVAPVITDLKNVTAGDYIRINQPVILTGLLTDVGLLDTHRITMNWGDGSSSVGNLTSSNGSGSFNNSHIYRNAGIYTVTSTLVDDDGGVDVETTTVAISGVSLVNGTLIVVGTPADDTIDVTVGSSTGVVRLSFGSNGAQVFSSVQRVSIYGIGGNDKISAWPTSVPTVIDAGDGDDEVVAWWGPATILGGQGNDRLTAGGTSATISGGDGDDIITGSDAADVLDGGAGNDQIFGQGGDDRLIGSAGNDTLDGGSGNDNVDGGDGDDALSNPSGGLDVMLGGAGNDTLAGSYSNETLDGGSGDDRIYGAGGTDTVRASTGNDQAFVDMNVDSFAIAAPFNLAGTSLTGSLTATINWGDGSSVTAGVVTVNGSMAAVTGTRVFPAGGQYTVTVTLRDSQGRSLTQSYIASVVGAGVVGNSLQVIGTFFSESITVSSAGTNSWYVQVGSNPAQIVTSTSIQNIVINAFDGDDTVNASVPSSLTNFPLTIDAGDGNDRVTTNNGVQNLLGGNGDDSLIANGGRGTIDGGAGNDYIDLNTAVAGSIALGGDGNDTIRGSSVADTIDGGAGDDEIYGDGGTDTIRGGDGNDKLYANGGSSVTVDGGTGDDLIYGTSVADVLDGGDGNDQIFGLGGDDRLLGSAGNDSLDGGSGNDNVDGGDGDDTLNNPSGGLDLMLGGAGNDTLLGSSGNETLDGGSGDDRILRAGGTDTVRASLGNDQAFVDVNVDSFAMAPLSTWQAAR